MCLWLLTCPLPAVRCRQGTEDGLEINAFTLVLTPTKEGALCSVTCLQSSSVALQQQLAGAMVEGIRILCRILDELLD